MGFVQAVVCDSPAGRIGLGVCYDLRFPELFQKLTWEMGAKVLTMPSAFTCVTGKWLLTVAAQELMICRYYSVQGQRRLVVLAACVSLPVYYYC